MGKLFLYVFFYIGYALLLAVLVYVVGAIVALDMNPFHWTIFAGYGGRIFWLLFIAVVLICGEKSVADIE